MIALVAIALVIVGLFGGLLLIARYGLPGDKEL